MIALILDDSPDRRSRLRRLLGGLGFEVVEAADVQQALDALEGVGPLDLALVDWNLLGRSGEEFVGAARARRDGLRLKVIMVTTKLDSGRVLEALRAGVD